MRLRTLILISAAGLAAACSGNSTQGKPLELERISFVLPAAWQATQPSSPMRVAQAVIPGEGGPAELAIFHFGAGQGGDVEANLQRWIKQIAVEGERGPQRDSFENGGLRITWVDVSGTLQPGQMGMGPSSPQPNSRLLGAVIEGDGGPWFVKVTGPASTLGPQREAFMEFLRSAKLRG